LSEDDNEKTSLTKRREDNYGVGDLAMIVYVVFECVLIFGALIFIGYHFILGILALLPHRKKIVQPVFNRSFLIVVHSHNEEEEISKTLYSLAGLVYPWNLYDFVVIADNCTDNTAVVSKKLGARILERTPSDQDDQTDIFHWTLEHIEPLDDKYDAIVFVGSNVLISGNFLKVMNQYLEEGSVIIQSANRMISDQTTMKVKYKRICWILRTFINALGRKKLNLGTMLLGNGTCFKTEILKDNSVELSHIQDDFGYSILLQTDELQVDFAPEAVVWSPLNDSSTEAKLDWPHRMIKQLLAIKRNLSYFFTYFKAGKLLRGFDMLIRIATISLALMLVLAAGNGIINLFLWKLDYISAWLWIIWMILAGMLIIYFSIGIAADRDDSPEMNSSSKKPSAPDSGVKLSSEM
jgi:cellulose synthase/poly-beta-1,6-N-acetylglucosamine synthase-like glycosyltransferase